MVLTAGEGYYLPIFEFDGKKPPENKVKKIGNELIKKHNEYAAFTRPYYDGWNAAYNGPKDHLDENGYLLDATESQYMKYMQTCINKIMPMFNKKIVSKSKYFRKYVVGDELELIGVMKNGCKVSFFMKKYDLSTLVEMYKRGEV